MSAAELLAPAISELLTWNEICARHPDEWVCLVEIDFTHPNGLELRTARVLGHGKRQSESLDHATSFPQYDEIGHFYTGERTITYLRPVVITDDDLPRMKMNQRPAVITDDDLPRMKMNQ